MKKILTIIILSAIFTGCSSTPKMSKDDIAWDNARTKYSPWEPVALSNSDEFHLIHPTSIKEVSPGVRRAWAKSTEDLSTMREWAINCYSEQIALGNSVDISNNKIGATKKVNGSFTKVYPDTVGYSMVKYVCKKSI